MTTKLTYEIFGKTVDEVIDMKNKILVNTTDKEEAIINIKVNEAYIEY
ncbi:hypothetical protein [Streptococcus parauberis]|nr:hypothetical protein [Streptococcus parauberis]KYP21667.1 hypothetical protein AKL14_00578 [Streptococcus parauberis]KYP21842.1 hypothetical protein AKL13_00342 [Streptococcus parauberis]KYP21940.1 hypothetical protein TN39_00189 [Streptococcus parauberis]KYP23734.1 hypothetical protein ADO04_01610 [Streptococcus parauberis]KYP25353.1 hypothetical protein TP84_01655 [Streptococcus parauberis]